MHLNVLGFVMWKLLLGIIFLPHVVSANVLELKKNTSSIYISEKINWEMGKDLFGIPYIYFSPQVNGQRSNISFTDTGAEVELDVNALSSNQPDYQENKKKWAEQVGASPLGFIPYKVTTNKRGHKIHQIGFNFSHEGKNYNERSYYIECRGKIIFSKSLRLDVNSVHDKDFDDLLSDLDCGGV